MTHALHELVKQQFGSTGHDRCDTRECGAQAYVRVEFKSGTLLFCGHHANDNWEKLQRESISVRDERARIGAERLDVSA